MPTACPHCACTSSDDGGAHAVLAALAADDLDAALAQGLLDAQPCAACDAGCNERLIAARAARRGALAARERHRARAARLARRKAEREAARAPVAATSTDMPVAGRPALPGAAADVLARALAKAAARKP